MVNIYVEDILKPGRSSGIRTKKVTFLIANNTFDIITPTEHFCNKPWTTHNKTKNSFYKYELLKER